MLLLADHALKDHSKITTIMTKRKEQLQSLVNSSSSADAFVADFCSQRDMFVVCDILSVLPLETYSCLQLLSLAKHLASPKFMLASKYKKHKIECLDALY